MIAIDLGSNTIRFLSYDCASGVSQKVSETIVRTAEGMHETGKIGDAALERIVTAIKEAKNAMDFSGPVAAVCTAAFRNASNQQEALKRLETAAGVRFKVIDPETEGYLTSLAVFKAASKVQPIKRLWMLDVGGASTELAYTDGVKTVSKSFDLGIVTAAEKYKSSERMLSGYRKTFEEIREFMADMRHAFKSPQMLAATSGTPTTMAAMKLGMTYKNYDREKVNGTELTLPDMEKSYRKLLGSEKAAREELVGVGREDLIMAGILLVKEIQTMSGFERCTVFDDGLREGLAIAGCKELAGKK